MSQQNVEIVLNRYARYNAGERRPDLGFWHEDAEYHAAREDPDSAIHRVIDAIRRQFEPWHEAYPDLRVEPLEAKGNGAERQRGGLGPADAPAHRALEGARYCAAEHSCCDDGARAHAYVRAEIGHGGDPAR
jgi:hypothetical protein